MVASDDGHSVTVDLRSVVPRLSGDSYGATVRTLICHRNGSISQMGSDDLSFCASTRPFTPGRITLGDDDPGTDSIVLAVTTHKLGTVTIEGVHVSYRLGLRRGSEDTGGQFVVKAARAVPPAPPITAPPTVTAVLPDTGLARGRTRVEIVGTAFTDDAEVRFGSVTVTVTGKEVSVVSPRHLVVLAPAHSRGVVDVRVVTRNGVSPTVAADHFTYR